MDNIYLGWSSKRKAYTLGKEPLVVLVDTDGVWRVLQDGPAADFKTQVTDLSHHLCGVRKNSFARDLLASVPDHLHHAPAYDAIFDKFFVE